MSRRVLLDTNVWREIVDGNSVQELRKTARAANLRVLAAPAVVHEILRTPDLALRRRLVKAVTLGVWQRMMPEVYVESQHLIEVFKRRRPTWLLGQPDLAGFYR